MQRCGERLDVNLAAAALPGFLFSFIDGEINCVFRQLFPPPHVSSPLPSPPSPSLSLSLLRLLRENIIKCGRHRPINIPCSTSERTDERTNRRRDGQLGVDSPLLFPLPSRVPSLVLFLRVLPPRARHSPFSRASVPTLHSAAHLARPTDEPPALRKSVSPSRPPQADQSFRDCAAHDDVDRD